MGDVYASGSWHVRSGHDDEFMKRWLAVIEWGRTAHPDGFERARLLREDASPSHFVSLLEWDSSEARHAWREDAALPERMRALAELCDDTHTGAYSEAVRVGSSESLGESQGAAT